MSKEFLENQDEDLEIVDNEILDVLREAESENQAAEKEVDVDEIFQRIDLKRVGKIFQDGKSQSVQPTSKSKKPTLIDEEYLKQLIYEQVELALDSAMSILTDKVVMSIQQLKEQK